MLRVVASGSLALLGGCISDWDAYGIPEDELPENLFFADADGDGWGDPDDPGQLAEEQPADTARNNRDCDDGDAAVTGRTGVICPQQLLEVTAFAPIATGGSEFIVVRAPTDLVSAGFSDDACGPFGWGGRLATFTSDAELKTVLAALESEHAWAGYVGFAPQTDAWGHHGDDAWVADSTGMNVPASRFCSPRATYAEDLGYLALVRDGNGGDFDADDWCLGTPDEAGEGFGQLYGHFVCERPIPDAAQYALGPTPEE